MKYLLPLLLLMGCSDKNSEGIRIVKYEEVCLGGHIYYHYSSIDQLGLAIKLTAYGEPIGCSTEAVEK